MRIQRRNRGILYNALYDLSQATTVSSTDSG
jgi:hypothetical protein